MPTPVEITADMATIRFSAANSDDPPQITAAHLARHAGLTVEEVANLAATGGMPAPDSDICGTLRFILGEVNQWLAATGRPVIVEHPAAAGIATAADSQTTHYIRATPPEYR